MMEWRPPKAGVLHLDVDASSAMNGGYGAGAIIHKSDGGSSLCRDLAGIEGFFNTPS